MLKQNRSIPPALKRNSRLNNSVVCSRRYKLPNAHKHGVFSRTVIIPGEDPREFEELYAELLEEWNPSGPTIRDEVFVLADLKWRKRRLDKFVQTQFNLNTFDPGHPAFNEVFGLCRFIHYLQTEPETCFEHAAKCLRDDKIKHLEQKCPRSKYQSTAEWVQAITHEILSFAPRAAPEVAPPESEEQIDGLTEAEVNDFKEATREWKAEQRVFGSIVYGRELLEYYAKESERLDARIARQINFLIELKAKLKMLGES